MSRRGPPRKAQCDAPSGARSGARSHAHSGAQSAAESSGVGGRAEISRRLQQSVGSLATSTVNRMEREMPWFRELSAQDRSWIGLIVQAGIKAFVTWYEEPEDTSSPVTAEIFGAAPRALAGVVSLHQTVEMVRLTIEVVEEKVADAVGEA